MKNFGILLLSVALCSFCSFPKSLHAETFSDIVGIVAVAVGDNRTETVSDPFQGIPFEGVDGLLELEKLAVLLAAQGMNGDLLHLWVGNNFSTYKLENGAWRIYNTPIPLPPQRLPSMRKAAMLTRKSSEISPVYILGLMPVEETKSLTLPAQQWSLINYPYPVHRLLNEINWDGSAIGDELRLWSSQSQSWVPYIRESGRWEGPLADSIILQPGTAFLYFNPSAEIKHLVFTRPYDL